MRIGLAGTARRGESCHGTPKPPPPRSCVTSGNPVVSRTLEVLVISKYGGTARSPDDTTCSRFAEQACSSGLVSDPLTGRMEAVSNFACKRLLRVRPPRPQTEALSRRVLRAAELVTLAACVRVWARLRSTAAATRDVTERKASVAARLRLPRRQRRPCSVVGSAQGVCPALGSGAKSGARREFRSELGARDSDPDETWHRRCTRTALSLNWHCGGTVVEAHLHTKCEPPMLYWC